MQIVLDSAEIIRDPSLDGLHFRLLAAFVRRSGASLVIPRLVVKESARVLANAWRELAKKVTSEKRMLSDCPSVLALAEAAEGVAAGIDDNTVAQSLIRRMQEIGATVTDFPVVTHAAVVDALLVRRKPFKPNGVGYRDALIWCTVVELAREDPEVTLISGNTEDFPKGRDGAVDGGLLAWFADAGSDASSVRIYHRLKQFIDEVVIPAYPEARETLHSTDGTPGGVDVEAALGTVVPDVFAQVDKGVLFPGGLDSGWYLEKIRLWRWNATAQQVRTMPEGTLLVTADVTLTVDTVALSSEGADGEPLVPGAAPTQITAFVLTSVSMIVSPDTGDVLKYEASAPELVEMNTR